jgi:hypothetical protein
MKRFKQDRPDATAPAEQFNHFGLFDKAEPRRVARRQGFIESRGALGHRSKAPRP